MSEGRRFDLEYETMPWPKCDAVVFDIGNVLIQYAPNLFIQQLFPDDEEMQKHMMAHVYHGSCWPLFDRGTLDYEEAAEALHQKYGYPTEAYLHAMYGWIDLKTPIEEGWRAVRRCRRAGMKLYLLSNYAREGYFRLRERFADRFELFHGGVISSLVQQMKPEKEIYETLIRTYDLNPERTLFIDDTLINVEGAMKLGIHGFHMKAEGCMDNFFL